MKKTNPKDNFFDYINAVASTTECTGLIQIPPTSDEEMESYQEIYEIHEQINERNKKKL